MPLGVLARMRLRACGWQKPGDQLAPPDATWWTGIYGGPLWAPLATYAVTASKAGHDDWTYSETLAAADVASLDTELGNVRDDLAFIQSEKADICEAYFVPRVVGVQPVANLVCIAQIAAGKQGKVKLPPLSPFKRGLPTVVYWGLIVYIIARVTK
jgi:hypothetical protein